MWIYAISYYWYRNISSLKSCCPTFDITLKIFSFTRSPSLVFVIGHISGEKMKEISYTNVIFNFWIQFPFSLFEFKYLRFKKDWNDMIAKTPKTTFQWHKIKPIICKYIGYRWHIRKNTEQKIYIPEKSFIYRKSVLQSSETSKNV